MNIYGIGNPLIDYLVMVDDKDISNLGLYKGTMNLIDTDKREEILEYIKGKDITFNCGGSCPNTMVTLKSLGIDDVTLAGGVGFDSHADMYRKRLSSLGLKDELVGNDAPTGTSIILVTEDRERTMCTYLGANRSYDAKDINIESVGKADIFHFTGYMWDTEPQKRAIRRVLEEKKNAGFLVSFDVADPFAVGRYRQTFIDLIRDYADIVFANSEEAHFLMDNYDPRECAKSLGKLCRTAIVKNGKRGSYISQDRVMHDIPVYGTSNPIDTTGAGDTYAAGFLYGIATGRDIETSGRMASFLAGEIISQIGAQFPPEKIVELRKRLETDFQF